MHLDFLFFIWAGAALAAVVVELHSQTIYLLALAAAFAAGAVLALAGGRTEWQLVAVGTVCLAGFPAAGWVRRHQARQPGLGPADVGLEATVLEAAGGALRVRYRGSEWDAVLVGGEAAPGDRLRIAGMRGSTLEVTGKR